MPVFQSTDPLPSWPLRYRAVLFDSGPRRGGRRETFWLISSDMRCVRVSPYGSPATLMPDSLGLQGIASYMGYRAGERADSTPAR